MKVIDLLNKISNDETIPGKIKYNRKVYHYGNYIKWYITDDLLEELFIDKNHLNDEIEIIEDTPKEDKKIEKLNEHYYHDEPALIDDMAHKINEIIDYLEEIK